VVISAFRHSHSRPSLGI